jgi:hypothetical protein
MKDIIPTWKDSELSQFAVRWLTHEFIKNKDYKQFEEIIEKYPHLFKPENMYLKTLLHDGQKDLIAKLFKDYQFDERTKNYVVNTKDTRVIKTAFDIGIRFNSDKYVKDALASGNVDVAKVLLECGCILRESDAVDIMNRTNSELVRKFIKMNVYMKGM